MEIYQTPKAPTTIQSPK